MAFQDFEVGCGRWVAVEAGIEGLGHGFAKLYGGLEDLRGFAFGRYAEKMLRLGGS